MVKRYILYKPTIPDSWFGLTKINFFNVKGINLLVSAGSNYSPNPNAQNI